MGETTLDMAFIQSCTCIMVMSLSALSQHIVTRDPTSCSESTTSQCTLLLGLVPTAIT